MTTQTTAQQKGAEALLKGVKDIMDVSEANITTKNSAQYYELKLQIDALRQEVVLLQNIVSAKKAAPKTAAKAAEGSTTVVADGAAVSVVKTAFASNAGTYFAQLYRDTGDAGNAFRAKYVSDAVKAELAKDETIKAKKNVDVRANAEARFIHNYLKTNAKALFDQFATEFLAAKKEHAEASKPPQQTAEPNTPPHTD